MHNQTDIIGIQNSYCFDKDIPFSSQCYHFRIHFVGSRSERDPIHTLPLVRPEL